MAELRQLAASYPGWSEPHHQSLAFGTINVRGVNKALDLTTINVIALSMMADIIAVVKTHWRTLEHKSKRIELARIGKLHLCATSHGIGNKQKGVALILTENARKHKVSEEFARDEEGGELGTALRMVLSIGHLKLHVLAIYRPPGHDNKTIREQTDTAMLAWLDDARDKWAEVVLMGDLNTDIWTEAKRRVQLGTRLQTNSYKDAWR
ncbi:hypothetical protein IWW38_005325, partial [Coemansia aciculifera]